MNAEVPTYEDTQKSMDVLEEKKIRWNVKQSAKGGLYWECTVRGDSIEEVKELMLNSKKELDKICGGV